MLAKEATRYQVALLRICDHYFFMSSFFISSFFLPIASSFVLVRVDLDFDLQASNLKTFTREDYTDRVQRRRS
jgi:hypothetical protein